MNCPLFFYIFKAFSHYYKFQEMKHFLLISWLFVAYLSMQAQDIKEYYFKFNIADRSELDSITQIISIDNVYKNEVYAYALQHELDVFKEMGYTLQFLNKQIPKSLNMATNVAEMENWDRYPTYEVYRQIMKNYESDYPSICKLDSIGTTPDGRKLYVLRITDQINEEENEPEFFYTSTMHGDETTGYVLMLRLIDSLLSNYHNEAAIHNLINEIDLYINPNANPDGTYAGGNHTVSGATRSNGYADINRDFPDPRAGANSPYQTETQSMMDFAEQHHFVMSANFHGGAEVMNYPWDTWYTSENLHADTDWFELVCTDYVTTARLEKSDYMTSVTSDGVTHGATWYKVAGGRQDYMNYWHQCREVTVELSVAKLLGTEYLNDYWNYNKQSLINYMKESLYGIRGTVLTESLEPINAMIRIINHDEDDDSSMIFTDPSVGNYHRLIEPGTYDLIAHANGFINDTIYNVQVNQGEATIANFRLISEDDSVALITNITSITDTLFFDELVKHELIIYNDGNAESTSYQIDLTSENNWISLNKNTGVLNGSEKDTVLVSLDSDLLSSGVYQNDILITTSDSKIDTIPIQLFVKDTISIQIIPKQITDTLWAGEMKDYRIIIENNGVLSLNYNILEDPASDWLSLDKEDGTLAITESDTLTVGVETTGFSVGSLKCNLVINKVTGTNDTITIHIEVKDTISFKINPLNMTDTLMQDTIVVYEFIVQNTGREVLHYTTDIDFQTNSNTWATTEETSGTIPQAASDTIIIEVSTYNLTSGNYSCNLILRENSGKERTVPISIQIDAIQTTTEHQTLNNTKVYPNPFTNYLMLSFDHIKIEKIHIDMYNTTGELIFTEELYLTNQKNQISIHDIFDISNLPFGLYFIQISSNHYQNTFKVIKN